MSSQEQICEICDRPIIGEPFSLSALDGTPRVLKVCESCSGAEYVTIAHSGIEVTVHRDDYIRSNHERFWYAIEEAWAGLEEHGWTIDAIKIQCCSDTSTEPMD
jgi:hypothetical protein